MSLSRGRRILSMLESGIEDEREESINPSSTRESSPAPSLTELKVLDPEFVNSLLYENHLGNISDDHFKDLSENQTPLESEQGSDNEQQAPDHSYAMTIPADEHHEHEADIFRYENNFFSEAVSKIGLSTERPDNQPTSDPTHDYLTTIPDEDEVDRKDSFHNDPTYIPEEVSDSESSSSSESASSSNSVAAPPEVLPKANAVSLVPYSGSDTEEDELTETKSKGKKRVRNEKNWKKNKRKKNILGGKKYISAKNKIVGKKSLKPPCPIKCRLKCNQRFTEEQRMQIHSEFWSEERSWDLKRQFISSCIKNKPIVRKRPRDGSRKDKSCNHSFTFILDKEEVVVCKTFFLNTLSISEMTMRTSLIKVTDTGLVTSDQRGKHIPGNKLPEDVLVGIRNHIKKFPMYESHYSRERSQRKYLGNHLNISKMYSLYVEECANINIKPAKSWVYSKIFNEEFNLSFHTPDNDTCDVCDRIDCSIKNETDLENLTNLKEDKENHLTEASLRYELKRHDKLSGRENEGSRVVMSDLQKCLPTPDLKNSQSFYSRKLWTLNSTIYDTTVDKTWCMIWDEVTAGRGGNEIASCLFTWATENLNDPENPTKTLTVWTDNCSGQNRNINMVYMYFWMLEKIPSLEEINHKFLLAGHTHMEVDGKHSVIERAKKQLQSKTICTTNDWANFISSCSKKSPFIVRRMGLDDFLDFLCLRTKTAPFVSRKLNTEKEPFLISNTVWLQIRRGESKLYYKTSFSDEMFKSIELKRNQRDPKVTMPAAIPKIRTTRKNISVEKYKDLMNLLQWIPEEYKPFFRNLPHGEREEDFPEEDTTAFE